MFQCMLLRVALDWCPAEMFVAFVQVVAYDFAATY